MEQTVEQKLRSLDELQLIYSKIDKIRQIRGELPMEVSDLEDDVLGLETRIQKIKGELEDLEDSIANRKNQINEANALIKKYDAQLKDVKNNREYDALTKEIEIQNLDIQVCEKKIKEFGFELNSKTELYNKTIEDLELRKKDLEHKKQELEVITSETEKEEDQLLNKSKKAEKGIEERLLVAFHKLRKNAGNGLAVATIARDSCAGCFNQIPPQRQLEIRQRKKIIVCEYCGRILVDEVLATEVEESFKG
ncbi:zinc ribbon domain-containing protein [Pedobacter flavus]|uniref:C4-type zinc ribbon domain-containing protein n=1 Tax=Pedobacter flavus TaxID=3113906 RepID=A0ABU7GZF2_9SPHI|nr:C4-type zinc ribbon domain-containing protein [Pedobacter sp. VNH31]MEE1884411.1 C4-type zinc ribbon domain-containing protein [Pedobacter sp. VNH31]